MTSSTRNEGGGVVCPACSSPLAEKMRKGFGWIVHTRVCSNAKCTHYFPPEKTGVNV